MVKDPVTEKYFRFTETQAVILDAIRSPIDIESLGTAVAQRLGGTVKPESLEQKMLLDTPGVQVQLEELQTRRPKETQNILYYKVFFLDAEKAFDWLFPKIRWCFTPLFHVFAAAMILSGFVITMLHTEQLWSQFWTLISVYGLVIAWAVVMVVTTMHEFAHGLTCRYFGGKVRRIGFMLIYFSPALYCDVSDAWMFPSKRQRVWVTFAGGYFQLVVWGMATIIWRVTANETVINNLALCAVVFGGVQTLFNFNPLIKLDGYYMLSDYLEIPNLREKAFKAMRAWLGGDPEPLLETPDRVALLRYAALAMTFTTFLLGVVYVNIYWLATDYFQFTGLVAFVVFSGFTLRGAMAEPAAGVKALVKRASRKKYLSIAAVAILLLVIFFVAYPLRIAAEFEILPNQEVVIRAETSGTIAEIHVRENTRVEKGDLIAELFDFEKDRQLSLILGELDQRRAELSLLLAGARAEEIDQAERLVETKETELGNVRRNIEERNLLEEELEGSRAMLRLAELELEKAQSLFEADLGPRFDMDIAAEAVNVREREVSSIEARIDILAESNDREEDLKERELAEAESALTLLMAGFRSEEIDRIRAEVATLERQQSILEDELAKREIRAPIDGTIVTPFIERLLNERLNPGDELGRIVDLRTVKARLSVPEKEMDEVRIGSRVVLKVRAYPSEDFEGRVDFIAPVALTELTGRFVHVRVELDNDNENRPLRPDMTGVAKIYAGNRRIIQLITRRTNRWIRTEFWDLLP